MTIRHFALISAASMLAACSAATDTAETAVTEVVAMQGADMSALPSGTYKSEQGHAYVAFQYSHQGYSRPIIRWGTTDATVVFDSEYPENSTLSVTLPVKDIDTGVPAFDKHITSADFFDVENFPEVTFTSTNVDQIKGGYGTLTGQLTIKDVTKPFTLTGTVNKVGKHFSSGVDMFGVSAKGQLKRSDFGVDKYGPMADDIEIMIEVEFQKAE